ncbi:MAG: hypothetical protein QG597_2054 [Actinomycetota bacterium]|nr:hypothetical protein [Actinomycetota bacterium]
MMTADMARTAPRAYRITRALGTSQTFTRTPVTSPRVRCIRGPFSADSLDGIW